jgi:hypothetical protein
MEPEAHLSVDLPEFLGRRTLIVGDVNAGKTIRTQGILEAMGEAGLDGRILILDLAPEIPRKVAGERGLTGIGGRLIPRPGTQYLWASPVPPRLTASTGAGAGAIATQNRERIERLIRENDPGDRDILFLNDVSLYLQAGSSEWLWRWMGFARTVVANGYYGEKLGGGRLSRRERVEMEALMECFDRVIRL